MGSVVDSIGWNMYEFAERLSRFTEPFYVRLGDLRAILKGPRPPGRPGCAIRFVSMSPNLQKRLQGLRATACRLPLSS